MTNFALTAPAVSEDMITRIEAELERLEHSEDIRILLAVESGSRAWGFHSPDSDYDVRFVYIRDVDWHLGLKKRRDVIELPIDDELDISGWDLGKALRLAMKSNAVIAEWLQSPIVYRSDISAVEWLNRFCERALSRRPVTWHYLSLLHRQQSRLIGPNGGVRLKRYFYCLRPALALRWMRLNQAGMPPMDMTNLLEGCQLAQGDLDLITELTCRKMAVLERTEEGHAEPILDALIEVEAQMAKDWLAGPEARTTSDLMSEAEAFHIAQIRGFE